MSYEAIGDIATLEARYGVPAAPALRKVALGLTPEYRTWIAASRFVIVSTVGPEGADASPRGDDGPVVREIEARTLALPDWRGNDRIDTLRNIVRGPRVALLFMVPGSGNVIRVNGRGIVTAHAGLIDSFSRQGKMPRTVIVVAIDEVYFQCARAILRSGLWSGRNGAAGLPTPGQMLASTTGGTVGGESYDAAWAGRAAETMW